MLNLLLLLLWQAFLEIQGRMIEITGKLKQVSLSSSTSLPFQLFLLLVLLLLFWGGGWGSVVCSE